MCSEKFILHTDYYSSDSQSKAVKELLAGIYQKNHCQTLLGVTGCGKTFVVAKMVAELNRPTLIIAHNKTLAAQLYGEMKGFFPKNAVEYFVSYYDYYQPEAYLPTTDTYIEKDAAINERIERMRLAATKSILERNDVIVVASVSAIYNLGDPKTYQETALYLVRGDRVDYSELLRDLAKMQYLRNDLELRRGTYQVRGELIDIFPAEAEELAIRLELFDQVLESIAYFDPLTGEVINYLPKIKIFPKTHYVTQRNILVKAAAEIRLELKDRLNYFYKHDKLVEAQRLKQRTEYDLEMLLELGYCSGIENYSQYLSLVSSKERPSTLIDYFPDNSLLVIDESHVTLPQLRGMYNGDRARKTTLVEHGFRLPSALANRPLRFEEFEAISPITIYVSATPGEYELAKSSQVVELIIRPTGLVDPEVELRPAKNQVIDFLFEAKKTTQKGERVLVSTLTKRMAEDLTQFLFEKQLKVRYLHSEINVLERVEILRDLRLGNFDILVGINLLREGLDLPEVSLVAIFDADKEGFLRSAHSLIQTSGRAARHVNGRVIMYADEITGSMKVALEEMTRRRQIQLAYNVKHQIAPIGIIKSVNDIMDQQSPISEKLVDPNLKFSEKTLGNILDQPKKIAKSIKSLEKSMYQYARNLEFEKAAAVRDQLKALEQLITNN